MQKKMKSFVKSMQLYGLECWQMLNRIPGLGIEIFHNGCLVGFFRFNFEKKKDL